MSGRSAVVRLNCAHTICKTQACADCIAAALESATQDATEGERARCEKAASDLRLTGPAPIGPLYGIGWNEAVMRVLAAIRATPLPAEDAE